MHIGAACINEIPIYKKIIDENIAHLNAFEGNKRDFNPFAVGSNPARPTII